MLRHLACCCAAGLAGALVPSCLAPVRTDVRIPPRLVQLWETDTAPAELEPMAAQWRRVAGWTARIWSDAENKRFIAKHYTWLLPTFRRYQRQVQRADIARLARLHLEGGVYSDLDTRPCSTRSKDLDKVLGPQLLTLVRAPTGNLSNFFIGSVAHHPFLEFVLRRAPAALDTAQRALAHLPADRRDVTMQATGPWMIDASWHAFIDSDPTCRATWIATTRIFSFAEWTRGIGVHQWASTWQGPQPGPDLQRLRRNATPKWMSKTTLRGVRIQSINGEDVCIDHRINGTGPYLTSAAAVESLSAAAAQSPSAATLAAERAALPARGSWRANPG